MRTVLLLMDLQRGIVDRYPGDALPNAVRAADGARAAGVLVVFVRVAFREGGPEIAERNRQFGAARSRTRGEDAPEVQVHEDLARRPDEPVVVKRRVSAFAGSDLEVLLRAMRAERLVLAGIATSGVVLSTLREAADRDFDLVVLRDACLDADDEVHRVLMDKVFPKQAAVTTVDEWVASLQD